MNSSRSLFRLRTLLIPTGHFSRWDMLYGPNAEKKRAADEASDWPTLRWKLVKITD